MCEKSPLLLLGCLQVTLLCDLIATYLDQDDLIALSRTCKTAYGSILAHQKTRQKYNTSFPPRHTATQLAPAAITKQVVILTCNDLMISAVIGITKIILRSHGIDLESGSGIPAVNPAVLDMMEFIGEQNILLRGKGGVIDYKDYIVIGRQYVRCTSAGIFGKVQRS